MTCAVTRPIPDIGIQLLKSRFEVTVFGPAHGDIQDALLGVIGEYDAMVALLSDPIDERLLLAGRKLKIVANHAVGYDNVDIAAARRHRASRWRPRDWATPGALSCEYRGSPMPARAGRPCHRPGGGVYIVRSTDQASASDLPGRASRYSREIGAEH